MPKPPADFQPVVHTDALPREESLDGAHFGGAWQVLTPHMRAAGGKLGLVLNRMPPGRVGCPLHTHQLEDEVFFILEGTGTLRYGDAVYPLRPGSCVSCPAGTGIAHQIANTGTEELVYLAAGNYEPNELCTYPESGKLMSRALGVVGRLERTSYMAGEPERPGVFALAAQLPPSTD